MNDIEARHRIAAELRAAGLRHGGAVLVHSSLKSLGRVPGPFDPSQGRPEQRRMGGGAETVIRGLLDALGPRGTLLFPALSYKFVDAAHPVFDVLRTPSCIGALPEYFRNRPFDVAQSGPEQGRPAGPFTLRSVAPTHSVCGVGAEAREFLQEHIRDDTPCGPNSPYRALRDRGGQILFLGCGIRPNTSMHGVEELGEPPYLFGDRVAYRVILADGNEIVLNCRRHDFHSHGCSQRYDRLATLLTGEELKTGKVLEATVHIVECRAMWTKALAALRRDPFFFVEKQENPD